MTARRDTSTAGAPRVPASYQCEVGTRQLVGQRINGRVALSDVPAGDHGRVYLVESHILPQAELGAATRLWLKRLER